MTLRRSSWVAKELAPTSPLVSPTILRARKVSVRPPQLQNQEECTGAPLDHLPRSHTLRQVLNLICFIKTKAGNSPQPGLRLAASPVL